MCKYEGLDTQLIGTDIFLMTSETENNHNAENSMDQISSCQDFLKLGVYNNQAVEFKAVH